MAVLRVLLQFLGLLPKFIDQLARVTRSFRPRLVLVLRPNHRRMLSTRLKRVNPCRGEPLYTPSCPEAHLHQGIDELVEMFSFLYDLDAIADEIGRSTLGMM